MKVSLQISFFSQSSTRLGGLATVFSAVQIVNLLFVVLISSCFFSLLGVFCWSRFGAFVQMPVETLGRAMVKEAESKLGAEPSDEAMVFSNKDIKKIAERHSTGP